MEENQIEKEIQNIKKRNQKVEKDKAWETSITRRVCIMILTYIVVLFYSYMVKNITSIWLSSLIPVIGFALSTLSLKIIRKFWEIHIEK